MKILTSTIAFCFLIVSAMGQQREIKPVDTSEKDIYCRIIDVSMGPSQFFDNTENSIFHRVVITLDGNSNGIYIEQGETKRDTGDMEIRWKHQIKVQDIMEGVNWDGEFAIVSFVKWIDWNTVELSVGGLKYEFDKIENDKILIERKK